MSAPDTPTLRDYQVAAVEACEQAATEGRRRALVALPTGTGKTVAFAALIRRRGGRALVVAHRDELLAQAREKLVAAGIAAETIGLVKAASDETTAPVVLASVQTLARSARRDRLVAATAGAGAFATIVIDEAHHAPAQSYRAILDALETPGTLTTGWTATPGRRGVRELFGAPVFSRDLVDMIAAGWLCDLRGRRVGIDLDTATLRRSHGDFIESALARALGAADAPGAIARAWRRWGEGRPTLVFAAGVDPAHGTAQAFGSAGVASEALDGTSGAEQRAAVLDRFRTGATTVLVNCALFTEGVDLAHETAQAFGTAGVAAEALDGSAGAEQRAAVLDRFRTGATTVLVNCALFVEGVDLPHVGCVVIGRPTLSPLLYAQMVGRGTRLAPGKADCLILDLVGASDAHDLSDLAMGESADLRQLSGLPLDDGASLLLTALENRDRRARLESLISDRERLVARSVALFGRTAMHWLSIGEAHVLSLGDDGYVVVNPAGPDRFDVHRIRDDAATLIVRGATLDAATAVAEGYVRRHPSWRLAASDARWRSARASDKQLAYLRRIRGVPADVAATLTRGEVSDLIDQRLAERRLRSAGVLGDRAVPA